MTCGSLNNTRNFNILVLVPRHGSKDNPSLDNNVLTDIGRFIKQTSAKWYGWTA